MSNRVLCMTLSALCISAAISAVTEDSIVPEADWKVHELPSPSTELMADSPNGEVEKALKGLSAEQRPAVRQAVKNLFKNREQPQKITTLDEAMQERCALTDKPQPLQTACDTYAATKSEENMHAVLKASFKREDDAAKSCEAWHNRDTTKEELDTPVLNAAAPVMDCLCNDQSTSFEYCTLIHAKSFQGAFEALDKTILNQEKTAWLKADTRQEAIANAHFSDVLQFFTLETGEELLDHSGQKTGKKKLALHHLLEQVAPAPLQELLALSAGDSELSRSKPTAQSSTLGGSGASKAVDGNTNTQFSQNSCTHTNRDNNPWWRVDLGATKTVSKVQIWNRGDCCGARLNGFQVRVGTYSHPWNYNPQCGCRNECSPSGGMASNRGCKTNYCDHYLPRGAFHARCTAGHVHHHYALTECKATCGLCATHNIGQGQSGSVDCSGRRGRYVHVVVPRTDYLTLCEVRVMGEAHPPPPPPPIPRTLSDGGSCDALSQQSFDPFSKMGQLWKSSAKFQKLAKSLKNLLACNLICDISDLSLGMECTAKEVAKVSVAWSIANKALKVTMSVCCPGISDIVGEIEKHAPIIKKHLNANNIEGGCLVLGRGTINDSWGTADLTVYPMPIGPSGARFKYDIKASLNYDRFKGGEHTTLLKACWYHMVYKAMAKASGAKASIRAVGFFGRCFFKKEETVDQNWKLAGRVNAYIQLGALGLWETVWRDTIAFWW